MNIKNRLVKLEDKLNVNSEFCNCSKEILFKIVPFDERIEESETVICETCHKPIPKHPPVTFAIGSVETNLIYPTINYNREEFEQWQNEHVLSQHSTYEAYLAEKEVYDN